MLWSPVLHLCVCTLLVTGRGWSPEGQDVSPLSAQEHAVQAPGRRPARQLHPAVPPEKFKNYRFCLENFDKILKIRQFLSSLKSKSQFPHLYVVKLFILAFIKYFG